VSDPADLLEHGELVVEGQLVVASNATLRCRIVGADGEVTCVYKPRAGEQPLWDFPDGTLAARELAAYLVSEAAGWSLVPLTILRDGPFGRGMCQLWVEATGEELVDVVAPADVPAGWLRVLEAADADDRPVTLVHADDPRLRRMALFDVVINNADRKAGHVLVDPVGTVRGVDHGVSFHVDDKLRTVLWGWSGAALTDAEFEVLSRLSDQLGGALGARLADLLSADEVAATRDRIARLLRDRRFPMPVGRRRPIPWPVF
jgi:uncharacterized repeat protein (TIGR03843 family)